MVRAFIYAGQHLPPARQGSPGVPNWRKTDVKHGPTFPLAQGLRRSQVSEGI